MVNLKASDGVGKQNKKRWVEGIEKAAIKFQIDTSDLTVPSDIFWHSQVLFSKDVLRNNELTIDNKVSREIVWELFNNNFALELLATDWVCFPCHGLSEDEGMDCDAQVAACFPESTYSCWCGLPNAQYRTWCGSLVRQIRVCGGLSFTVVDIGRGNCHNT